MDPYEFSCVLGTRIYQYSIGFSHLQVFSLQPNLQCKCMAGCNDLALCLSSVCKQSVSKHLHALATVSCHPLKCLVLCFRTFWLLAMETLDLENKKKEWPAAGQ